MTYSAGNDADTLAGIVQDVLDEHMSLGTSGRYLTDYGVSPSDLAEMIATRVIPPAEDYPDMPCEDCEQGLSSCCIPPAKGGDQ